MAEGSSFLSGSIDLPVVGSAPKWAVYGIGGIAVVYVGYKWWSASSGADDVPDPVDPGYSTGGEVLPEVENAYPSDGSVGIGETPPSPTDYGFTGTSNDEWSQYATIQLTQSAKWEYTDIITALGSYLAREMLTAQQVDIVQAAIAVAGYPPEGDYTIKQGGGETEETGVAVAPTGVTVTPHTDNTLKVTWNAVDGAWGYKVFRDDAAQNVGGSKNTTAYVSGLRPGETYTIRVAAVNAAGKAGPKSAPVQGKTEHAKLKAPTGVRTNSDRRGGSWVRWNAVPNAESYRVFHNRAPHNVGVSRDTEAFVGDLDPGKSYTFYVRAVSGKTTGPKSNTSTVRIKR